MLRLSQRKGFKFCDGMSRRSFLQVGALAGTGLTLPTLLANEARAGVRSSHKSAIIVYLSGGLSHQDSFDLKPNAPAEIRGEFKPIPTNVAGLQICELLPKLAKITDKYSILRSIVGQIDEHSSFQSLAGAPMAIAQRDGKPNMGAMITKILGAVEHTMPAFVDLFPVMQHRPYNSPGAGRLGRVHAGVTANPNDLGVMTLSKSLAGSFDDRRGLLQQMDRLRSAADTAPIAGMDIMYDRAYRVLTSNKLVSALDVEREPASLRDRYGRGSSSHQGDGAPLWNDQLLMARRLVEAGARLVTVAYGFWDTHGNNFSHLRGNLPVYDQGISALIEDLHDRGLDKDVAVLVWGEFGRTPKINANAGRDHWSRVNSALLAGGGFKTGQFIGSTDSTGAYALDRPIHYHDVIATIYKHLGIDAAGFIDDLSGRPTPILSPEAKHITELFA